jgi:hypothetical protein
LMSSMRRRLIASWLIILELRNWTCVDGLVPRKHVDRHGVIALASFAHLVCVFRGILMHLGEGTSVSFICSMIFGRMIIGNAPGVLPCVVRLCVRTFVCIIRFDVGLFAFGIL